MIGEGQIGAEPDRGARAHAAGTGFRTSRFVVRLLRKYLAFFILLALCAIGGILSPAFLEPQNLIGIAYGSSWLGIVALGQTMLLITCNFDMSVAGVIGASGIAALVVLPFGTVPAILAGLAVGALTGVVNGTIVRKTKANPFLVTFGTQLLLYGVGLLVTQSRTLYGSTPTFDWLGHGKIAGLPVPLLLFVSLAILLQIVLLRTTFGRSLYAIGHNREAARLSGVPVRMAKFLAYTFSGLMCAVAGIAQAAQETQGDPVTGDGYELIVISMVAIGGTSLAGGRGSMGLTLLGILTIGYLNKILSINAVSDAGRRMITGIIIVLAVLMQKRRTK